MEVLIILLSAIHLATSQQNQNDLQIDYYKNIINDAISAAKTYQPRKSNSDLLGNVQNTIPFDYGEFDFIVVGSESSGSAFAAEISEVEKYEILLLEAGDFDDDLVSIPYVSDVLQFSDRNYGYFSTNQLNGCFASKDNRCSVPQGKILGGIDSITYIRGNRGDYDKWASMGNPGWSFKELLPYFKKVENFQSDQIDLNYRGFAGPVNVAYRTPEPNFTVTGNAYEEIGVETIADYNAEKQIGVSPTQLLTDFGKRVTGSTAYVRPTFTRHNFNLTLKAFVTKILINDATKTAYGVQFVKGGKKYQANVRQEVIVALGPINTAQLLMLSGIGPAAELSKHNIPIVANLPVGTAFKSSVIFNVYFSTSRIIPSETLSDSIREFVKGKGVLASVQNGLSVSFHNTRDKQKSRGKYNAKDKCSQIPNIEIAYYLQSPINLNIPKLKNYVPQLENFEKARNPHKELLFEITLLHPKSTGNITLKSNDPIDFPNINLGIFDDPDDLEVLYEGIQIVKAIENTTSTKFLNPEIIKYDFCKDYEYDSKEYWFCALKYLAYPGPGRSSSVRMGPKGDPYAVVDNRLCVKGIKKLRIPDRSTLPITISGNYNPVAFAIGVKAADMVKEEYAVPTKPICY